MEKSLLDHIERYEFSVGEVVTVGGNPNVLAEVVDISEMQLKVRVLTPPHKGNTLYTTRYTYYTTPMPNLTPQAVSELVQSQLTAPKVDEESKQEVKVDLEQVEEATNEPIVFSEEVPVSIETTIIEVEEKVIEQPTIENEVVVNQQVIFTNDVELEQLSLF